MAYITIDVEELKAAWEAAPLAERFPSEATMTVEEALDLSRKTVVKHLPQSLLGRTKCLNCHAVYPCKTVLWAMRCLRVREWQFDDTINLIRAVLKGELL